MDSHSLNNITDVIGRPSTSRIRPGTKVIVVGTLDTQINKNMANYSRYQSADLGITGDPEATTPYLIQAIDKLVTPARRAAMVARGDRLKEMAAGDEVNLEIVRDGKTQTFTLNLGER